MNEKDLAAYQRVDWLVYKLGTKVHSYFWLDKYSSKDDFLRYWKDERVNGSTLWSKALKFQIMMLSLKLDLQKWLTRLIKIELMFFGILVHNSAYVIVVGQKWVIFASMFLRLWISVAKKGLFHHPLAYFNTRRLYLTCFTSLLMIPSFVIMPFLWHSLYRSN